MYRLHLIHSITVYVIVIRWRRVVYGLYTSGSVFIGHEGVARVVY